MAPVIHGLRRRPDADVLLVATAQHRDMLDSVLGLYGWVPDVDLDIMSPGQTPSSVAAAVLDRLPPVLRQYGPDWVLVQGDTTTVVATALAAAYAGMRVGHVEAGLRSYDRANPFPEEINRVLTSHMAQLHFAPTAHSCRNLLREGVPRRRIVVTGNTVLDALTDMAQSGWQPEPTDELLGLPRGKRWLLVTAHRRESFGEPLGRICDALSILARRDDVHVVFPVHPNPAVDGAVRDRLVGRFGITLTSPLDYRRFAWLLARSHLVLTDSGGIQEEAPVFGKPVLVMRDVTERPEAVEAGTATLVGTATGEIVAATSRLLDEPWAYEIMARAHNPFGDGHAAGRIVTALFGEAVQEWTGGTDSTGASA